MRSKRPTNHKPFRTIYCGHIIVFQKCPISSPVSSSNIITRQRPEPLGSRSILNSLLSKPSQAFCAFSKVLKIFAGWLVIDILLIPCAVKYTLAMVCKLVNNYFTLLRKYFKSFIVRLYQIKGLNQ